MVDQRLKALSGTSRRDFLRWAGTVAACLGLERSRLLNVINDTAGSAAADVSSGRQSLLSCHIIDGNGGLSNYTQLFPFPKVIGSTNAAYSHYALGKGIPAQGYDQPWTYAPDSPWQDGSWKMTAFVAGNNETHTGTPASAANVGANSMLASIAAIQQANPTLLPVLSVGGVQFGSAPGAPQVANVGTAAQLVGLFNSAASQALLQAPTNGALAEAYYKAFIGLNAAAGRSTNAPSYATGKVSMNLLSKNLSSQLTPTAADQTLFGLSSSTPGPVQQMSLAMITAVRAMGLGLTSMIILNGLRDDPHGRFASGDQQAQMYAQSMGAMFTGLQKLGKTIQDPASQAKTIADAMVLTIHGDTHKDPFNRNGWGDGTSNGSNVLYVMGQGWLKTGLHGDQDPANGAQAWDPTTGQLAGSYQGKGTALGQSAAAAALYAVTKGDLRRVGDFYNGPQINGVINLNVTG